MIDKSKFDTFRHQIESELSDWAKENHLTVHCGRIKYDDHNFDLSIRFDEVSTSGEKIFDPMTTMYLRQLVHGTSLEGQNPIGHYFYTMKGNRAKLVGYDRYKKYSFNIEEETRRGIRNVNCDRDYICRLQKVAD